MTIWWKLRWKYHGKMIEFGFKKMDKFIKGPREKFMKWHHWTEKHLDIRDRMLKKI